jgi:hypothetical protein
MMTYEQENILHALVLVGILFLLYSLRHTPLGFLWKITRIFLIILFGTLLVNKFKGDLKDWWNKD